MKRIFISVVSLFLCSLAFAQFTIVPSPEYVQIESSQGIEVKSLVFTGTKGYTVTFFNNNYSRSDERNSYSFDWYLSYKGKRVSDYYSSSMFCRQQQIRSDIYAWPGSVPAGFEKYVTVQFGKEKPNRDRRDDE